MRRWRHLVVAAAVTFAAVAPAAAQEAAVQARTADQLAALCRMEERAFCYGFVNGAGQFYEALIAGDVEIEPFVCPGREVTRDEAVDIFMGWLAEHPESGNARAVDALFQAWASVFPCE